MLSDIEGSPLVFHKLKRKLIDRNDLDRINGKMSTSNRNATAADNARALGFNNRAKLYFEIGNLLGKSVAVLERTQECSRLFRFHTTTSSKICGQISREVVE